MSARCSQPPNEEANSVRKANPNRNSKFETVVLSELAFPAGGKLGIRERGQVQGGTPVDCEAYSHP
jgi:hypothetical protein